MKRIIALLLLVCLMPCVASAVSIKGFAAKITPTLPSFDAYKGSYLSSKRTETKDYLIYREYSGKPSNVAAVATSYVNLLVEQYGCDLIETFSIDCGTFTRNTYVLTHDNSNLTSFYSYSTGNEPTWKTQSGNVILQYTVPDSGTAYIYFRYSTKFNYKDNGDRYYQPSKGTTTQTDTESSATR